MMLNNKIKEISNQIFSDVLAIRRHLHAHPELSFEEYNTSQYVQHVLNSIGVKYSSGWVKTGIVAHIEGKNPGKRVIALRADLDALPIQETNAVEYKSQNAGVMHACGHDVHTSSLLGAVMILNQLKNEFEGTVKFIFQPGEEKLPGGAKLMIEEGALKNPDAEIIIGQHVFPELEAGLVGFRKGMYMASTDEIHLKITGRGGHAALPHQYDYTTMAAAEFMVGVNKLHQDLKGKSGPSVLAFGKIIANGATNVIPAEVRLEGTLRALDENFRMQVHEMIQQKAKEVFSTYHCGYDLEIKKGYPVLYNHELVTTSCIAIAEAYLGKENVKELEMRMTAEDFAYYSQQIPSCFYRLGTANTVRGINAPVHTSGFDIDEEALKTGAGLLAFITIQMLNQFPLPAK